MCLINITKHNTIVNKNFTFFDNFRYFVENFTLLRQKKGIIVTIGRHFNICNT